MDMDVDRRFAGVRRLYGEAGFAKLLHAHVVVVGIGGVGSWAAEALARNALGQITLIDLDHIAESNTNRQIHALEPNFGQAKVSAMQVRILQINPQCQVQTIEDFVTIENVNDCLPMACDVVIDCTDDVNAKIALALYCRKRNIPCIMSGSAGGRLDPTRLQIADLSQTTGDRLLAKVRHQLRRNHGFPSASQHKKPALFGIPSIFIDAPVIKPTVSCQTDSQPITGLNCAGYGSSVCVTAAVGFAAASVALNLLHQA